MNAIASPPPRRRGPPPAASTPDDAAAELERLARNRADPRHRPVMRPDAAPLPPHTETSPAFRHMQSAAALAAAQRAFEDAQDAAAGAKGRNVRAAARKRIAQAKRARDDARADLNRELERQGGGDAASDAARIAFLESQGRVQPSEHDDPDDANERAAKPRQVRGHRTACRVRFLLRRDKHGGLLREAHVRAADTLRLHWDVARYGLSADPDAARTRRSGPRTGPTEAEHAQAHAARLFAEAIQRVGIISDGLLRAVVLDNWTISRWCDDRWERAGKPQGKRPNEETAMGLLVGALDRLAAHYDFS